MAAHCVVGAGFGSALFCLPICLLFLFIGEQILTLEGKKPWKEFVVSGNKRNYLPKCVHNSYRVESIDVCAQND
jgi:hypothetical protein